MTLRHLQSSANNPDHPVASVIRWEDLNNILDRRFGAPALDYKGFNDIYEKDPMIKSLVQRFDGQGLVVKTNKHEPTPGVGEPVHKKSMKASAALKATKRTDKA